MKQMTEQMLEHLVAILVAFKAKMMAKLDFLASWMEGHQAKTHANHVHDESQ
jgi:hypothetical protein